MKALILTALFVTAFAAPAHAGQIISSQYDAETDTIQLVLSEGCNKYDYEIVYHQSCARSYPGQAWVNVKATLLKEENCRADFKHQLLLEVAKTGCGSQPESIVHVVENDGSTSTVNVVKK